MGHPRNALIQHRESARSSHRRALSLNVQNAHLTDLHRHWPEYHTCARRLLASVAAEANRSYIYQMAPAEMAQTIHQSVGINPGVIKNITAVSDDGYCNCRASSPRRSAKHAAA